MPDESSSTGTPSELQEPPLSTERPRTRRPLPRATWRPRRRRPEVLADSLGEYVRAWGQRIRGGESGALPIIVGLIVILIFFQLESSQFDSAGNLVNLLVQASIYILLGAAEIFVLCCRRSTCRSGGSWPSVGSWSPS